jgi:hypothetical protein
MHDSAQRSENPLIATFPRVDESIPLQIRGIGGIRIGNDFEIDAISIQLVSPKKPKQSAPFLFSVPVQAYSSPV